MSQLILQVGFLAGTALTLFQVLVLFAQSRLIAEFCLRSERVSLRLLATLISAFWISAALFYFLIYFGLFDRVWTTVSLVLTLIITGVFCRRSVSLRLVLRQDIASFWNWSRNGLTGTNGILAAGLLVILALRIGRGLIAPPLAWDALTYHLLKAGRWVQAGKWVWEQAPDAWQFYEYFSPLGDSWWAWTMLGTHSDSWLAISNAGIFGGVMLGVYCIAGALGIDCKRATLAAVAAASVPAVLNCVSGSYVDNTALMLVVAGSALVILGRHRSSMSQILFAVAAFGLAVGIKVTFLPFLGVAILAYLHQLWVYRKWQSLLLLLPILGLALAWQIALVMMERTPFYPVPFSIFGRVIEKGNPVFWEYHFAGAHPAYNIWRVISEANTFLFGESDTTTDYLGFGWPFLLLLAVSVSSCWTMMRSGFFKTRRYFVLLILAAMLVFFSFWTPGMENYRRVWLTNMARFSTIFYVVIITIVACRARFAIPILVATSIINYYYCFPRAWTWLDYRTAIEGAFCIAALVILSYAIFKRRKPFSQIPILAAIVLLILVLHVENARLRYAFFEGTRSSEYDVNPVYGKLLAPEAVKQTDTLPGVTIDYTGGYGGRAWWWYRYPFLGSNLQNNVVYIPPTDSGAVWNRSIVRDAPPMNYDKWKQRLASAHVQFVFCVKVMPIEYEWMKSRPDQFTIVASDPADNWCLFRVKLTS